MKKEAVNKFDLEAAFKALNEVEIPVVKGIRPNRENLQEKFTKKLVTEVLVEDYFDVSDAGELEQAQEEREAEIAKAKLARIEKIVDLDAETEEDLLPSYVGKFIIQCPQCMTLFYKKEEDIEKSDENPDVVNLNEPCQHCGNSSGYTLVGKVDQVGEDEAEQYDAEDFEEDELNLDFDETEEPAEDTEEPAEETSEESTEEEAATEGEDEDLAPIEETDEEEVKESLTEDVDLNKQLDLYNDFIKYLQKMVEQDEDALEEAKKLGNKEVIAAIEKRLENSKAELKAALPTTVKDEVSADELPTPEEADMEDAAENKDEEVKAEETTEKKESLTEDFDAEAKLDAEETALKKTNVEEVVIEAANSDVVRALDNLEAELTESLPREPQVYDANGKLIKVKDPEVLKIWNKVIDQAEADGITGWNDYTTQKKIIDKALTPDEIKKLKNVEFEDGVVRTAYESLSEANYNVSDAEFSAMLKNPVFNEACKDCKEDLTEDIPPVNDAAFERATAAIEAAGSELTPEEQRLEDEELAVKENMEDSVDTLEEDAPQSEFVSQLKRNYSITELIAKELKTHPSFSRLSIRTIQRVLLPYYIEQMGRKDLSTQAVVDFFEFEGFAPYVFDNFMTMDPLARKELLKADAKFMEIFNAYAKEYQLFPGSKDDLVPGESEFDYAFSIVFDFGDNGEAQDTPIARDTIKAFAKMYANGKFDRAVVESPVNTWESVEDLDDESFNKLTENYLTEVYSNVKSFKATNCDLTDNKLVIEGIITFNSGKSKTTTFVYEAVKVADGKIILEGLNSDFASEKAFKLNCKLNTAKCLIIESLNYNYTINENLVKGSLIK